MMKVFINSGDVLMCAVNSSLIFLSRQQVHRIDGFYFIKWVVPRALIQLSGSASSLAWLVG
jgi:hypothetical protein